MVTQSSVFEDNPGDIVVVLLPCLNPTSKFISAKYHWFLYPIESDRNGSKLISNEKFYGKVNPADIFTKIKSKESEFVVLRKLLCGW